MKRALAYDDINIVPKYSEIEHRDKVDISTKFTKKTILDIPLVSSPMDTVTEVDMAKELMDYGGVGVIHRFNSIEEQSLMMKRLHKDWKRFFDIDKDSPHTLDDSYTEYIEENGIPQTDDEKEDLQFYLKVVKDRLNMDERWRKKPLCAAIGVTGDYLERAEELIKNGCNVLLIDVAHGHHKLVGEAIGKIKTRLSSIEVIAGSVATGEACEYLCEKGADAIRIGIGNGSLCETRIRTGVGIPQVTALIDCVAIADTYGCPTVADGGIRTIGDVCKGLACGADSVMLGSLLSGTKESPGEIEKVGKWPNEQLHKKYRGSASLDSKKSRGDNKNVEGNHKVIPYKGKVKRIVKDIQEGINSSFSYVGANNISEFHSRVELIEVTRAGNIEGEAHLL
jgi:IMP dehydrogenase